jgi:hypothetical protein
MVERAKYEHYTQVEGGVDAFATMESRRLCLSFTTESSTILICRRPKNLAYSLKKFHGGECSMHQAKDRQV